MLVGGKHRWVGRYQHRDRNRLKILDWELGRYDGRLSAAHKLFMIAIYKLFTLPFFATKYSVSKCHMYLSLKSPQSNIFPNA